MSQGSSRGFAVADHGGRDADHGLELRGRIVGPRLLRRTEGPRPSTIISDMTTPARTSPVENETVASTASRQDQRVEHGVPEQPADAFTPIGGDHVESVLHAWRGPRRWLLRVSRELRQDGRRVHPSCIQRDLRDARVRPAAARPGVSGRTLACAIVLLPRAACKLARHAAATHRVPPPVPGSRTSRHARGRGGAHRGTRARGGPVAVAFHQAVRCRVRTAPVPDAGPPRRGQGLPGHERARSPTFSRRSASPASVPSATCFAAAWASPHGVPAEGKAPCCRRGLVTLMGHLPPTAFRTFREASAG